MTLRIVASSAEINRPEAKQRRNRIPTPLEPLRLRTHSVQSCTRARWPEGLGGRVPPNIHPTFDFRTRLRQSPSVSLESYMTCSDGPSETGRDTSRRLRTGPDGLIIPWSQVRSLPGPPINPQVRLLFSQGCLKRATSQPTFHPTISEEHFGRADTGKADRVRLAFGPSCAQSSRQKRRELQEVFESGMATRFHAGSNRPGIGMVLIVRARWRRRRPATWHIPNS